MPLYENGKYHILVIGDMHPVKLMDGNKVIYEPKISEKTGTNLTFSNTYNDFIDILEIEGKTIQGGTPTPSAPIDIQSVENFNLLVNDNETYMPYALRSLPNGVADKLIIDKANQSAWIERNVGYIEFNGTEGGWGKVVGYTNYYRFHLPHKEGTHVTSPIMCTHFENSIGETAHIFWINATYLGIQYSAINDTLAGWTAYLASQYAAGTPVTIAYQLAAPVIENIDYADIETYYPALTITTDSTLQPNISAKVKIIDMGD